MKPSKMTVTGIGLAIGIAVVTGVVVANWTSLEPARKAEAPIAPAPAAAPPAAGRSTTGVR